MTSRANRYLRQTEVYLAQAHQELGVGDVRQASEKAWGAAAQIVKAVAEERGRRHGNHRRLRETVDEVAQETGDFEYVNLFKEAEALHGNFYEGFMRADAVQESVRQVEQFVERMRAVLNAT